MGLLMSDTVLIDPLPDETLRLRDGLGAWAYVRDAARDFCEHEVADPTERTLLANPLRLGPELVHPHGGAGHHAPYLPSLTDLLRDGARIARGPAVGL